jgi:nucleoside-diphosphate-sugar epimerase
MSKLEKSQILIMGGSGFVGPRLVKCLQDEGANITLLNRGTREVKGTRLLRADRNIASDLSSEAESVNSFDAVVDLSCYNVDQARLAWEFFHTKIKQWIHLSSAAVYSVPESVTPREDNATGGAPIWGDYGVEKSQAEDYLISADGDATRTILRPPYLYGPGNDNDRETFVWARALRGRPVLVPGDGTTPIQLLHVDDLAAAILGILVANRRETKIYNIAADEQVSLHAFVTRLAAIVGSPDPSVLVKDSDYGYKPRDYFPFRNYPCRVDSSKLMAELGWKPEYDFESGFSNTYESLNGHILDRELDTGIEDEIFARIRSGES